MTLEEKLEQIKKELLKADGNYPGIYKITHIKSGRSYVGQSKCIVKRIVQHVKHPVKAPGGIDEAIAKYGVDAFEFTVLEALPDATADQLLYREWVQINKENTYYNGYNKTLGNYKHCAKVYKAIQKFTAKHVVPTSVIKNIPFTTKSKLLIHNFADEYFGRLCYDEVKNKTLTDTFVKVNSKGELKEDVEQLGDYLLKELTEMIDNNDINYEEIIANPPYGDIGAKITKTALDAFNFASYFNLEPGNDYFTAEKLYRHIDPSFKPVVFPVGAIADASQVTVLAKLQKDENNLSEVEARILLHLTNDDSEVYEALKEYIFKVNLCATPLVFSLTKLTRRHTAVSYDENLFMFNSGSYDIINGYYSVTTKGAAKDWTDAVRYNVFKQDITTKSDIPAAYVNGCIQFKKVLFSKLGFGFMKVLFSSLPEGWGLKNLFPNIDYTKCTTIVDVFNAIGLSAASQTVLLSRLARTQLSEKEQEVIDAAEAL